MSDRRTTPATERRAHVSLRGQVSAELTEGYEASVGVAVLDICSAPHAGRDRQTLFGAEITVIDTEGDWAFVWARAENYCGWVLRAGLTAPIRPTHVLATNSHLYPEAGFKTREIMALSIGSEVEVFDTDGQFARVAGGYIPRQHLRAVETPAQDPVAEAAKYLRTPYLWGGNSSSGIDCSGLVYAAYTACGHPCPADSDQQRASFGQPAQGALARGDLLFWRGHVAILVDENRIIHANSTFMTVMYEGLDAAMARIERQGDGPFLGARRL